MLEAAVGVEAIAELVRLERANVTIGIREAGSAGVAGVGGAALAVVAEVAVRGQTGWVEHVGVIALGRQLAAAVIAVRRARAGGEVGGGAERVGGHYGFGREEAIERDGEIPEAAAAGD